MDLQRYCINCMHEKGTGSVCPACGFNESATPSSPYYLHPRTILQQKYMVGRAIGQGGFAITYLAWDINLGIRLALKEYFPIDLVYRIPGNNLVMAHTKAQDAIFISDMEKFIKEARLLARFIDHPNIVSVTDYFQANRTAYLVMNYIEGITMREYLARSGEKLSFDVTMGIMMPVFDALIAVHEAGLLHRDISPENIIISKTGRVMLIDFGAARRSTGNRDDAASVVMKSGYTPAEQYSRNSKQGAYTDVYAVAATIYRSITGQLPPNALDRLQKDTLLPPSAMGVSLEPEIEKALLKALSVSAAKRHQDMKTFQQVMRSKGGSTPGPQQAVNETRQYEATPETKAESINQNEVTVGAPATEAREQKAPLKAFTTLGDIRIGRALDNEVVIDDEFASRYHAMLFSRDGKWYIADLESTHGTTVNGQKIDQPVELVAPSEIKLSKSILTFDGAGIFDQSGTVLYKLREHVSFSERLLRTGAVTPGRLLENFIASLNSLGAAKNTVHEPPVVKIGRAPDNDLVLADAMVSRYHARLFFYGGGWYLADLQSTHGTKVNGEALSNSALLLAPSAVISLSDIDLIFDGTALHSADGELLFRLDQLNSAASPGQGTVEAFINDFFTLKPGQFSEKNWLYVILLVGMLGVALIFMAVFM